MWEVLEQILRYKGWQKENMQEFTLNLKKNSAVVYLGN